MFEFVIFYFFAAIAVVFALVVILHRNPVVSAMSLVVSFFALAVMYVLLDAPFLAALQVIVYAGAIMVLFLFVIMLLNLQHAAEEPTRPVQQFLGYTSCAAFGAALIYYLLKYAVLALPEMPFHTDARQIGVALFEAYVFPFEMVSILLLASIVGALFLSGRSTIGSPTTVSQSASELIAPSTETGVPAVDGAMARSALESPSSTPIPEGQR